MGGYVGRSVRRVEDERLLRGKGRFLDDIRLGGMAYAHFVRSQYPHALIKSIDVGDASRLPGVLAVVTYRDIEGAVRPWEFDVPSDPMYPLARGRVRYYGEPVAVVVAEDPYTAADAAELVVVDYEPLEAVTDPVKAMEEGAPRIHSSAEGNVAYRQVLRCGDVEKAFSEASIVVEDTLSMARVYAAPMEPRGVVAHYDGESLTIWSSTQTPFDLRDEVLEKIAVAPRRVRVIQPDVGGAFGSKIPTYPEEVIIPYLSITLRRPVKWYPSRGEDMVATVHGRDMRAEIALAAGRDGRILGIRARIIGDLGAYPVDYWLPGIAARILTGAYDIRNGVVEALGVYTNKTPLGPYRGAGRPEGIFFIERMIDLLADETGIDPVDLRLRNMVRPEQMPYKNCFGFTYDSGDYPSTLRRAVEMLGLEGLREWASRERSRGRLVGVGLSFYVEITSGGPFESAKVRIDPGGRVVLVVGSTPTGQGSATTFAQIAADVLGVDMGRIEVSWGDTGLIGEGVGTFGSRTTAVGGGAVIRAVEQALSRARGEAARILGVGEDSVEYEAGYFYPRGDPARRVSVFDVASRLGGIEASVHYKPERPVYPFGVHVAVVEVDGDTGRVRVLEYRSLDDVGRAINPLLVEGQIVGGVVQGVGEVFYEEYRYGEDGFPLTASLADYGVPTSMEAPGRVEVRLQETPTHHPHGVRGVGEIGSIAAPPALVRALEDALRPRRVRVRRVPVSPEEVYRLLRGG